eukprot:2253270-Karenia_brevis.AAC.1
MGLNQFAIVRDKCTVRWLQWLLVDLPGAVKLWPSSGPQFRIVFQKLCQQLHIGHLGLMPSSLRAG